MTPAQRELARHALGLPNTGRRSYRNRFYATPGTPNEAAWDAMVAAGHAVRPPDPHGGRLIYFLLTRSGAEAALRGDERLDLEDFPHD